MSDLMIYGVVMFVAGSVCERLFAARITAAGVRSAEWVARKLGWRR
jgi:hypothetical protein